MASFYPHLYEAALTRCVEARILAALSQSDLAARFALPASFVTSYEDGDRLLDAAEFIAICRAIGVDPYALLQEAEKASGD